MTQARFRIQILSDRNSWKDAAIASLAASWRRKGYLVRRCHQARALRPAELTFILGYFDLIPLSVLRKSAHNLVVHESDLPRGRGWSPLSWRILEGARDIRLSLFEAQARVDSGPIYLTARVPLKGNELLPELRAKAAAAMTQLCRIFVSSYPAVLRRARPQQGRATYYPRRTPADCQLDPTKSLKQQFDLLRICDSDRYPAFFKLRGKTFQIHLRPHAPGRK